jgi:NAD(P)-dependent dehydrogenase (short-subunit alcohol dehydrogenase family)
MNSAIVLGARPGNIGGAIVDRLNRADGWNARADDCDMGTGYEAPRLGELYSYQACIITLGVTHMNPIGDQDTRQIHNVIYGSLELPLICVAHYVRARRDRGGKIVLIGSYAHDHPFTHCTTYNAAKAGLDAAAKALAWELMPNFSVHIIHPFHVRDTPMTEKVLTGMQRGLHKMSREEALAYQRKDLRMPDLLTPGEIADLTHLLLTEPVTKWLAGASLDMYGGSR